MHLCVYACAWTYEVIQFLLMQILGVFDWSGCNPMPPEYWMLPSILPIHPGTYGQLFNKVAVSLCCASWDEEYSFMFMFMFN